MGLCADCLPAEQPVGVGTVPAPVGTCGANNKAVQAYVSLHSPDSTQTHYGEIFPCKTGEVPL